MFTVREIINKKPFLEHIPNDVISIEDTLKELDDGYRFFYNHRNKRFEVHNLNNQGISLCLSAEELDGRIVKRVYSSFVAYHGDEIDKMDDYNAIIEAEEKRKEKAYMEDLKKDLEKPIAKAITKDETSVDYEGFHIMPGLEKKEGEVGDRNTNKD